MIGILICFFLMLILQIVTPYWWWIIVVPFAYCLALGRSTKGSVLTGLCSAGVLWLLAGVYMWATGSQIILSRVAVTMIVRSPILMLLMATVVAAAAGALAGGAGYSMRAAFRNTKKG